MCPRRSLESGLFGNQGQEMTGEDWLFERAKGYLFPQGWLTCLFLYLLLPELLATVCAAFWSGKVLPKPYPADAENSELPY